MRQPAAPRDQAVTLSWLTRQSYEAAFDFAVARFRTHFPLARVERDQQSNNGNFNQKLESGVAAGTPPDVAYAVGSTYHGQAALGIWEDLTPFMARDRSIDAEDFFPFWLEAGKWRNRQYFFPWGSGTMMMFWNKRLFNAAGVRPPDAKQPMTWPQLLDVARPLTDEQGTPGGAVFGLHLAADRLWYLLPWQMGVDVFDKDYTRCQLSDPRAIDALQFSADLMGRHRVWRPVDYQGPPSQFIASNVALSQTGYWESGPIRDALKPKGEDFDVVPFPTFPGRPRLTVGWGSGHAIVAGSRHKDMSWEFVKHLSDREVYDVLLDQGVDQPVRKSQQNSASFRRNSPPYSFDVPIEDTRFARTPPFHPAMTDVARLMATGLADAYAGKSAVKPLVDQLVPQVNQKLAEWNERFPAR